jgi:ABC-type bacteriocin/lantibiotic exporter with double-glycine peptidase domain
MIICVIAGQYSHFLYNDKPFYPIVAPMKTENQQLWGDIWSYVKPYRPTFWQGTLLAVFSSSIWLIIPWAIGEVISFSAAYVPGDSVLYVWQLLGIIGGVTLLYYSSEELARFLVYMVGEKASVDLQTRVLRHMGRLDMRWHESENSGNKLKKIDRGGRSINTLLRMYIDTAIDAVVALIGVMIIFGAMHWQLIVLLVVFFVCHYLLSSYLTLRATEQARRVNAIEEEFSGLKYEILNGISTVKTLGIQEGLLKYIREITGRMLLALGRRVMLFRVRLASLGFNQQFFRILVIAFSVWQVIQGHFAVGVIAQVFFYFSRIESSAQRFSSLYHRFVMARIDLIGVRKILQTHSHIENQGELAYPANWQRLTVKGLSFAYQDTPVLRNLNLSIRRGEKIGLVGASGGGKSTLFKLLQKLYDDYEGFIGFDDVSLRDIRRESLSPHIGVVLQDTELFNLSIRENIILGQEHKEEAVRLEQAVQMSHVGAFAFKKTEGLQTLIGEKGIRLSGGEKQRLGLARALYRKPRPVVSR